MFCKMFVLKLRKLMFIQCGTYSYEMHGLAPVLIDGVRHIYKFIQTKHVVYLDFCLSSFLNKPHRYLIQISSVLALSPGKTKVIKAVWLEDILGLCEITHVLKENLWFIINVLLQYLFGRISFGVKILIYCFSKCIWQHTKQEKLSRKKNILTRKSLNV